MLLLLQGALVLVAYYPWALPYTMCFCPSGRAAQTSGSPSFYCINPIRGG